MIKLTNFSDLNKYFNLPDGVIDFVLSVTPETENGTYNFGEYCFVKVMNCSMGKASGLMETHDVYVDAQCLITDCERIYYTGREGLTLAKPYDEESDATFYQAPPSPYVDYKAGECIIFYPEDAHMPGCAINEPLVAKKLVIKINREKLCK